MGYYTEWLRILCWADYLIKQPLRHSIQSFIESSGSQLTFCWSQHRRILAFKIKQSVRFQKVLLTNLILHQSRKSLPLSRPLWYPILGTTDLKDTVSSSILINSLICVNIKHRLFWCGFIGTNFSSLAPPSVSTASWVLATQCTLL